MKSRSAIVTAVACVAVLCVAAWGGSSKFYRTTPVPSYHAALSQDLFLPAATYVHHDISEREAEALQCLALNVYWEARSEPVAGQIAVAAVTLNRSEDPRFPEDICDVVRQGGEVRRHRCQFSWWCDGKKDDPEETDAWRRAQTIARLVSAGVVEDPTRGAMWYHADYVQPHWAPAKQKVTKIGRHIFYTLPEPQPVRVSENTSSTVTR